MRKILIGLAIALLFAGNASAQQLTSNLSITADVNPICTVSTNPVVFTGYTGAATVNSTTGSVTTQCSNGVTVYIGLDAGQNLGLGSDPAYRALTDGLGNFLSYVLYSSQSPTEEWGDNGLGGTYNMSVQGYIFNDGNPYVVGIVADLVTDLNAVPGSYSDNITVIVQF